MIYDSDGLVIRKSALSYRNGELRINNISDADSTEYVFEIVPGFAHESSAADIELTETTFFRNQYDIDVLQSRRSYVTLYPSLPKQIEIYLK